MFQSVKKMKIKEKNKIKKIEHECLFITYKYFTFQKFRPHFMSLTNDISTDKFRLFENIRPF